MNEWEEKFQQLKRNALYPFARYRDDETQYMLLELFWTYLFKSVVASNAKWRSWHEPDRDRQGNPLFSALDLASGRGTRVIQHPGQDDPDVKTWGYFSFQPYLSHTAAVPFDPERTILEFCFMADVSEESEACARKFWKWFCVDGISEAAMEAEIKRYELSVGMPNPGEEREPS
jgi:hypothetical protein